MIYNPGMFKNLGLHKDFQVPGVEFLLSKKIYMKKFIQFTSSAIIIISCCSFLMVGAMAFMDPQKVMDLVAVSLDNNDALSSIRGVYGGVGFSIAFFLLYLLRNNKTMALGFLGLVWGFYALSRIITIIAEGPLGSFGSQWLVIESLLFLSCVLLYLGRKKNSVKEKNSILQTSLHSLHESGKEHSYQGV
jgi:hypothetical protein